MINLFYNKASITTFFFFKIIIKDSSNKPVKVEQIFYEVGFASFYNILLEIGSLGLKCNQKHLRPI